MHRLGRFDKIEGVREERKPDEQEDAPTPPRAEFFRAPAPEEPTVALDPPPPTVPLTPEAREQVLEHLRRLLPTLECPACSGENGKFSAACRLCQHPLDGDDALEHNRRRLEQLEASRLKEEVDLERRLAHQVVEKERKLEAQSAPAPLPAPPSDRTAVGITAALLVLGLVFRSGCFIGVGVLVGVGLYAWRTSAARSTARRLGKTSGGPKGLT